MQNHEPFDTEKLLLIKASAGSGKTHRLTGEYLRLLFSADNQYKYILAVTFTNKATDEMKTRIVEELHTLTLSSESDYHKRLQSEFNLSDEQIKAKARDILENILHDYSSFSISTIDKFFQQTMRAFAREMGLSGGYKIELDQNAVLAQIIDLMISELDKPQNKDLLGWIHDYMRSQIEDGKGWDVKDNIGQLAKQLFNEKYKLLSSGNKEQIEDKKHLKEYRATLTNITRAWENEAKEIGARAISIMSQYGLDIGDFKYGTTSGLLIFAKWANKNFELPANRVSTFEDNIDNWASAKTTKLHELREAYHEGLNECVKHVIAHSSDMLHYNSAKSILRNFYTLGILDDVNNRLKIFQKDNNTLFLSDTTELLNKIIADSDAPFIYEKTGTQIINFMIDEFQDTSSMQWQNFKPLIEESLSNGKFNLIVGDVKQSIYRWRNSDWGLLEHEIPKSFDDNYISNEVLDTNWRSDANIVKFNNSVFHNASRMLQAEYYSSLGQDVDAEHKIIDAYKHVYQLVPKKKDNDLGHIKISFIDTDDEEDKWQSQVLSSLPKEIESLQDQGFALKDIAILVRTNSEAIAIAEHLLKYKEENVDSKYRYDLISNEALVIGNAQSVRAAVSLIKHFKNRKDDTKRMLAVYEYNRFHRNLSPERALLDYFESSEQDFPEGTKDELNQISTLPFYEMVEAFFSMHRDVLDEKENVYVQAFLDIVLKFSTESSSNVGDFIEWWEESGCRKTLFSPDNQDAIRLMTIHKSKGLGFNAVILPFLGWEIDHRANRGPILWCKPLVAPFDMLDAVPLAYSPSLNETIFNNEYQEEKLYTYIDNLNLLYVAFTRAKNRIVAFAPKPKPTKSKSSTGGIKNVASLLWNIFGMGGEIDNIVNLNNSFDADNGLFEMGRGSNIETDNKEKIAPIFESSMWQSIPFDNRLKLRLNFSGFFSDDGSRAYGTLMHEIISEVETLDDVNEAVEAKYMSGEIELDKKEEIKQRLNTVLSIGEAADWYSGKYRVVNETQILHPKFGFSRPDRVMIGDDEVIVVDYKFGEIEDAKYVRQVKHYMKLIKEMGYDKVKGFLFYITNETIKEVIAND